MIINNKDDFVIDKLLNNIRVNTKRKIINKYDDNNLANFGFIVKDISLPLNSQRQLEKKLKSLTII